VAPGERHRGIEADDRELAGDVEDCLDDGLANLGLQVIELRRVVPRHARAVVAVVDVAGLAAPRVGALEHDRRVGRVPVVVLDLDRDPLVVGKVSAGERVRGIGRIRQL